jgi:pimeloyl-ACP methyl ester carboxylesterase
VAASVLLLAACGGAPTDPPAQAGDLYQVDGQTAHLQCQGAGSPTLVFLGGRGFTTTTWAKLRAALGPDVRTCAWDYPGVGHSTGARMMTAARAASSLYGTLLAATVPRPVILVGHSIAGLTIRLYVGRHPADVAGVVLFDPTVTSFARMFDDKEFRPAWDGTASADQAEQVTTWPDIPFEILRHDPAVYVTGKVWSRKVEARWGADQAAFAALAPHGTATVVPGSGHNVYQDAPSASVAAVRRVIAAVKSGREWPLVSQPRRATGGAWSRSTQPWGLQRPKPIGSAGSPTQADGCCRR